MIKLDCKVFGANIVNYNKKAFTLAELLIAMLIFSLLAVLLVPNVTNNAEKELFATQLKKVQNDVQQAVLLMLSQNQGSLRLLCSGGGIGDTSGCFVKEIANRLEKNVTYDSTDISGNACASATIDRTDKKSVQGQACLFIEREPQYQNKNSAQLAVNGGNNWENPFSAVNLKNGASVAVVFDPICNGAGITDWTVDNSAASVIDTEGIQPANICGYIEVDVNAGKVPNVVGKDIHYFWIVDQDGIIPFGEVDTFTCGVENNGRITTLPKDSNEQSEQLGCTARILQRGKIDYY